MSKNTLSLSPPLHLCILFSLQSLHQPDKIKQNEKKTSEMDARIEMFKIFGEKPKKARSKVNTYLLCIWVVGTERINVVQHNMNAYKYVQKMANTHLNWNQYRKIGHVNQYVMKFSFKLSKMQCICENQNYPVSCVFSLSLFRLLSLSFSYFYHFFPFFLPFLLSPSKAEHYHCIRSFSFYVNIVQCVYIHVHNTLLLQ